VLIIAFIVRVSICIQAHGPCECIRLRGLYGREAQPQPINMYSVLWSKSEQPIILPTWHQLHQLLVELHNPLLQTTLVYYDNVNAVYPVQHQRTKHVEIDLYFIRESIAVGDVRVLHVPKTSQFTDIFTKRLPSMVFSEFRSSLNIGSG
jgi:hypothetical protein